MATYQWLAVVFLVYSNIILTTDVNVGAHVQHAVCFSTCRPNPTFPQVCNHTFSGTMGDGILDPFYFGNSTRSFITVVFIPNSGRKSQGGWKVQVYPVLNNQGDPLFGWFYIILNSTNTTSFVSKARVVAIQGESHRNVANGAGEFLFPDGIPASCKPTAPSVLPQWELGRRNILPCAYTSYPYHLSQSAFAFGYPTVDPHVTSMTALHRLAFPPCGVFSSIRELIYRVYVLPWGNRYLWRPNSPKIFVKDYAYGATDPQPPKGFTSMICSKSNNLTDVSWISSVLDNQVVETDHTCSPNTNSSGFKPNNLFYGSCSSGVVPSSEEYRCDYVNEYYHGLRSHTEFLKDRGRPCMECERVVIDSLTFGYSVDSEIGIEIWSLRKSHGIALTFVAMFIVPVSSVFSRYFKETFKATNIAHIPVWYASHIHFSMVTVGLMVAGILPGVWARSFYGFSRSLFGRVHTILGWCAIMLFLVTFLSSGFRCYRMELRNLAIFLHFFLGNVTYGLCLMSMLTSCWVPGSPSTKTDTSWKSGFETVPVAVLAWIGFDFGFHWVMMLVMKKSDAAMKLTGTSRRVFVFGIVPIPISAFSLFTQLDALGGSCRKAMLKLYFGISLFLAVAISVFILINSPFGRFFGPTSYTHKPNGNLYTVRHIFAYSD